MTQSNGTGGGFPGFPNIPGFPGAPVSSRFQPYILEPGSPSAFACFGSWESARSCMSIDEVDDPLDGCSQSIECRRYTLEQNPPTTRFSVKPRRDGRFEIQQFKDFIRENNSYHMKIELGRITVTYPGKRTVPKSKRFFLHVKHLEEAELDVERDFELIITMERMVLRQAGVAAMPERLVRPVDEDPEARRRRIAEKLRKKASSDASSRDVDEDELDIDIELDVDDEVEELEDEELGEDVEDAEDDIGEIDVEDVDELDDFGAEAELDGLDGLEGEEGEEGGLGREEGEAREGRKA